MSKPESIKIDEVEYVRKDSLKEVASKIDNIDYVVAHTRSAGVFAGYQESRNGQEMVMCNARRLWYWDGAASLSQLAMSGTSKPANCKFPETVDKIELFEVIEILHCTEVARISIAKVPIWKI